MNETLVGAIIGAAAIILGFLLVQAANWRQRSSRKKIFAVALGEEVAATHDFLSRILNDNPLDGTAPIMDRFLRHLSTQQPADHLFLSLLPNLDVLPPEVLRDLSASHVKIRMAVAHAKSVLERGGSFQVSQGETKSIRETAEELVPELDDLRGMLQKMGQS